MNRSTLTILLARLVMLSLFVFASCGATFTWTTINGTCPSSCGCFVNNSSLAVGYCSRENIDEEQLSEQIDSLLSNNLTYRYLTHGHLAMFMIINTSLMHVPRSVCRLTTLQELMLIHNPLTRLPDNCFTNLTALTGLVVDDCHITKLQDKVFDGLHKLEKLHLNNNNITELQDGIFDGLRMLKDLRLDNNRISSIGLRAFDGLSKLLYLNLQTNRITQLHDGIFDALPVLKTLNVSDNRISSIGSRVFDGLQKLLVLYLNYNNITELPDGIFDGLHKVDTLYLSYNNITKLPDGIFHGLRMLNILQLGKNRISSIGLRTFDGLSKLGVLNLHNNSIIELQDGIFDKLPMLFGLFLYSNRISSIGSRVFDGLSKLRVLYLYSNHITQLQDGIFDGLRMLVTLDVSGNRISSIGSRVFGGSAMKNSLRYISLSHNRIQTLDSWPMYIDMNQTVKLELSDNNIHRFTNMMRWKENCGMRKVHFDLLLERNPIMVTISDLLRGWDMSISSIWCSSPPLMGSYGTLIINYVYFDCDCVDFVIFTLRVSLTKYNDPMGTEICDRSLILNKDNTIPLDQFVCELTERCPSGCRCVHRPANATLHIYCSNTNLIVLPHQLPELPKRYTKYKLDFSNNRLLRRLEHRDYFVNTSILDVSNSGIHLTESADVWNDILKISQVNLYGNKITSFPQSIILSNITTVKLNIAKNPWDCSCDKKWMSGWLKSIAERLTDNDKVLCCNPPRLLGKNIIQTNEEEFCSDPTAEAAAEASKRAWIISVSSVTGVLVVLLSVIGILYRLRVKLYTRWKFHPFDRDECPGEDMDYDVFLCCSSLDDEPGSRILDSIEANGYRVCYHERDFMPGCVITANIETSVTRSKRTVCLLTSNFIRSPYCMFEFETALRYWTRKKRTRRLIVLMALDRPNDLYDNDASDTAVLRQYLRQYTYIDYPAEDWLDKLIYALPLHGMNRQQRPNDDDDDENILLR